MTRYLGRSGRLMSAGLVLVGLCVVAATPAMAASCGSAMTLLRTSEQKLLDARTEQSQVERQFNAIYQQEQQLKAQAAQARRQ